jgi:hypothetical protein
MITKDNHKEWGTKQPFKVPDGYFDDFEYRLKRRIVLAKRKQTRTLIVSMFGIAAAIVIAVLLYAQSPKLLLNMHGKHNSVASEYIVINLSSDDFDENELIEYIKEQDINVDIFPDSLLFAGINKDELFSLAFFD